MKFATRGIWRQLTQKCLIFLAVVHDRAAYAHVSRLIIPARVSCDRSNAYIDFALQRCVEVNPLEKQLPTFSPCPTGTHISGRRCIGSIKSDYELACDLNLALNQDEVCTRAEAYSPPRIVCPIGYKLTGTALANNAANFGRTCSKRHVIDAGITLTEDDSQFIPSHSDIHEIVCPEGYVFQPSIQRPLNSKKVSFGVKHDATSKRTKRALGACVTHIKVPPSSKETCTSRFAWSERVGGCLMLLAEDPYMQCPKPDLHVGAGRGDWNTPSFQYDEKSGKCVAEWVPALDPRCPPGWALEGLFNPICHKKIYSAVRYDCGNTQGFLFKWTNDNVPVCEYVYEEDLYAAAPSYLSARTKSDSKILRLAETPWKMLKGESVANAPFAIANKLDTNPSITKNEHFDLSTVDELFAPQDIDGLISGQNLEKQINLPKRKSGTPVKEDIQEGLQYNVFKHRDVKPRDSLLVSMPNQNSPFGGRNNFGAFSAVSGLF